MWPDVDELDRYFFLSLVLFIFIFVVFLFFLFEFVLCTMVIMCEIKIIIINAIDKSMTCDMATIIMN